MPALEIIELKKTWLISLNYGRKDKLYYSNILLRKVLVYFNALQRSFWLKKRNTGQVLMVHACVPSTQETVKRVSLFYKISSRTTSAAKEKTCLEKQHK